MNLHTTTRIPVDDEYSALVGKAVYTFAYYEWTIIWIIESMQPGFVHEYSRGKPLTSGNVLSKFQEILKNPPTALSNNTHKELNDYCEIFEKLIIKRNVLIHAHPITDKDGSQILAYQTQPNKPLPDMKWSKTEVQNIIFEIDKAAVDVSTVLEKMRVK